MPDSAEPLTYCFDEFLLDKAAGALLRRQPNGTISRVQLGSRAFQLLSLLVERKRCSDALL
jgi:DNA-binding winged helix-turn-helix (wHTH) protein